MPLSLALVRLLLFNMIVIMIFSSGTGGTIAGTGCYLRSKKSDIKIVLADPEGSGLYNKVRVSLEVIGLF
jgi:cysteine synthase